MTPDDVSSLKCVIAAADRIGDRVDLTALVSLAPEDIRPFGDEALVVWSAWSAAELRDRIAHLLPDASVLVVEFERWSGSGPSVDADWLARHGH